MIELSNGCVAMSEIQNITIVDPIKCEIVYKIEDNDYIINIGTLKVYDKNSFVYFSCWDFVQILIKKSSEESQPFLQQLSIEKPP